MRAEDNGAPAGGSPPERRRDILASLFADKTREEVIEIALRGGDYADEADAEIAALRCLVLAALRLVGSMRRGRRTAYDLMRTAAAALEKAGKLRQHAPRTASSLVAETQATLAASATAAAEISDEWPAPLLAASWLRDELIEMDRAAAAGIEARGSA